MIRRSTEDRFNIYLMNYKHYRIFDFKNVFS